MKSKKKYISLSIVFLIFSAVCIASLIYKSNISSCDITNDITQMLNYLNVDNCQIKKLGNYDNLSISSSPVTVSQKDITEYIQTLLDDNGTSKEITDRVTVQKDDLVILDYKIYCCDEEIKSDTNVSILVGSNNFDSQIEQLLIGVTKDTMFEKEVLLPEGLPAKYYNEKAVIQGKVTSIKKIIPAKLTDTFAKENFDCNSVQEFNDYIYNILKKEYETDREASTFDEILTAIIKNSKFNMNKDELTKYSLKTVDGYKDIAGLYNMTLEQYRKSILNVSEPEFFQMCYDETEKYVEEYLIIGAISSRESISISEKELDDYLLNNDYSLDEKENEESICYLKYQLLRKKVYNSIIKKSNISK